MFLQCIAWRMAHGGKTSREKPRCEAVPIEVGRPDQDSYRQTGPETTRHRTGDDLLSLPSSKPLTSTSRNHEHRLASDDDTSSTESAIQTVVYRDKI